MNKKIASIITLLTIIGLPSVAQGVPAADDQKVTTANEAAAPSLRSKVAQERNEVARKVQEAAKEQIKGVRATVKEGVLKVRAELKDGLAKVKDERKKARIVEIDERLPKFNKAKTDHFTAVAGKLKAALERIKARAAKVEARKIDISSVRTAIADANAAIDRAEAAIAAQAAKQYSVTFTNEKTLRQEIKSARDVMHGDLKAAQDWVKAAQDSVRRAAVALAQVVKPAETPAPVNQ